MSAASHLFIFRFQTSNQDTPLMVKRALFGNDVSEHAYHLNYQNRRADWEYRQPGEDRATLYGSESETLGILNLGNLIPAHRRLPV
jgi:hypothetical protein